jgi:cytoskeletal protein CcmA (bactofilin family)
MFSKSKNKRKTVVHSLIGQETEVCGDVMFSGGLHIDGTVKGSVIAVDGSDSILTLSELGRIEGDVRAPDMVINGTVVGNVYGGRHIELAGKARIQGNVYYSLIEMAIGAEVNGNLVHAKDLPQPAKTGKQAGKHPPALEAPQEQD